MVSHHCPDALPHQTHCPLNWKWACAPRLLQILLMETTRQGDPTIGGPMELGLRRAGSAHWRLWGK